MLVPVSCSVVWSVIDTTVFAGENSEPKKAVRKEKTLAWKIVWVLPLAFGCVENQAQAIASSFALRKYPLSLIIELLNINVYIY